MNIAGLRLAFGQQHAAGFGQRGQARRERAARDAGADDGDVEARVGLSHGRASA
jgi:hypothetical protein